MDNFSIQYKKVKEYLAEDEYYEYFKGLKPYESEGSVLEDDFYIKQIQGVKKIILSDLQRILNDQIPLLKDHKQLSDELSILLETYNNGVDCCRFKEVTNFIVLTDQWLCFNNIEEEIDDLTFAHFGKDTVESETIVIIRRDFSLYYFITIMTNLIDGKESTWVDHFHIQNNTITTISTFFRGGLPFLDYSEEEIRSIIERIERREKRYLMKKGEFISNEI